LRNDPPEDLVTADPGQITVEDDHVVRIDRDGFQRRVAVERQVGRDRLQPQPRLDRLGEIDLVLDDQHPHTIH
jgi:hypothetical protein